MPFDEYLIIIYNKNSFFEFLLCFSGKSYFLLKFYEGKKYTFVRYARCSVVTFFIVLTSIEIYKYYIRDMIII